MYQMYFDSSNGKMSNDNATFTTTKMFWQLPLLNLQNNCFKRPNENKGLKKYPQVFKLCLYNLTTLGNICRKLIYYNLTGVIFVLIITSDKSWKTTVSTTDS